MLHRHSSTELQPQVLFVITNILPHCFQLEVRCRRQLQDQGRKPSGLSHTEERPIGHQLYALLPPQWTPKDILDGYLEEAWKT